MKSLNQIKAKLASLQQSHAQLNDFYFGELYELEGRDNSYPLFTATLMQGSLAKGEHVTRLMLTFSDLVNKDYTNKDDVLSDMQLVAMNIYSQLYEWCQENQIVLSPDATFYDFIDARGDDVSGWVLEIEMSQFFTRDACTVPSRTTENFYLLLENGDYLLLENGDKLILN